VVVRRGRGAVAILAEPEGFRIEINGAPSLDADGVVLAVPHDRAARLLPPGSGVEPARLARLGTSPIVNVHVVYDRRVFDVPFAAGVRTPVQWLFDRTGPARLERGQYLAISLSAADE